MSRPSGPPLDDPQVNVLLEDWLRDVMQGTRAMIEDRLRELGLLGTNGSAGQLYYPVLVGQNDRPIGIADQLMFKGSGVQCSWDQSGGQVTILIAGEDTFTLLLLTGASGTVLTPPTSGLIGWTKVAFPCTVIDWELTSDVSGSITVDIRTATYTAWPTLTSITGGAPPAIVSNTKARGQGLQAWSTKIDRGSYIGFVASGVAGIERVLVALTLQRQVQGYQGG